MDWCPQSCLEFWNLKRGHHEENPQRNRYQMSSWRWFSDDSDFKPRKNNLLQNQIGLHTSKTRVCGKWNYTVPSLTKIFDSDQMIMQSLGTHTGKYSSWIWNIGKSWWRHHMETFSALLAICAGNSPVPGEFPAQRPVTRSFDTFFDLRLNKRLSKHSWGWWFETLSHPLLRHCNVCYPLLRKCHRPGGGFKSLWPRHVISPFY